MNINWKVRLKNPVFWLSAVPAVISMVYTILGLLGIIPSVSESVVVDLVKTLITFLVAMGVLVDPTTAGVSDSARAMTYEAPATSPIE